MRDLYKWLGVSSQVQESHLQTVLESCPNAGLKADAKTVLLNAQLRRAYDQAHRTATQVGVLRANLGLTNSTNWSGNLANDFGTRPSQMPSRLQILRQKIQTPEFNFEPPVTSTEKFGFQLGRLIARAFARRPVFCWSATMLFIGWCAHGCYSWTRTAYYHSPVPAVQASSPRPSVQRVPDFREPEQPLPLHSEVRGFTGASRVAPFEIRTSSGGYYFIKLVDSVTGKEALSIFVYGGLVANVDVPLGAYEVRYASGSKWYGYNYLFGPQTTYSKANEVFRFEAVGNQIRGYTVTLYKVAQGNLRTQTIRPEDF